ncbi:MAG: hypothetical protein NC217_00210 [Muribaculaceae bacterium]|nr:hypothetical protein [Muribaculaceae bacterium]
MKLPLILIIITIASTLTACSSAGGSTDTLSAQDTTMTMSAEDTPVRVAEKSSSATDNNSAISDADYSVPEYTAPTYYPSYKGGSGEIPKNIEVGMPVSLAMQIQGVKQTVSAVLTGGKITGTVVLQHKGKSYYTNVDFAEEGGYAFGTRCNIPEQVAAFIELACSEQLTADDFSPGAVVTELIK